jgi:hypothetical protein
MKMEQAQCSEMSAVKHHTPGNPKGCTRPVVICSYSAGSPYTVYAGSKMHVKEGLGKGDSYLCVLIHGLRAIILWHGCFFLIEKT